MPSSETLYSLAAPRRGVPVWSMRVSPSKMNLVTTVVEVSFATTGLNEFGSEMLERTIWPPRENDAETRGRVGSVVADGSGVGSGACGFEQPAPEIVAGYRGAVDPHSLGRLLEMRRGVEPGLVARMIQH